MIRHNNLSDEKLRSLIKAGKILVGGNAKLKIYGKLDCRSGKRMNRVNRLFFQSFDEAVEKGFRPCAHCLKADYTSWKQAIRK